MTQFTASWMSWKTVALVAKIALGTKIVVVGAGYLGWALVSPTAEAKRNKWLDHVQDLVDTLDRLDKIEAVEYQERSRQIQSLRAAAQGGWTTWDQQWTMLGLVRFASVEHAKATHAGVSTIAKQAFDYVVKEILDARG